MKKMFSAVLWSVHDTCIPLQSHLLTRNLFELFPISLEGSSYRRSKNVGYTIMLFDGVQYIDD